jgi:hypothetical protein
MWRSIHNETGFKKTHSRLVQHTHGEKINMNNEPVVVGNSPGKKKMPKLRGKAKPGFRQLVTDAGCSQKAANELLKWYTNSK